MTTTPATTTTPQSTTASAIAKPLEVAINYGKLLVTDIPDQQFAHMPHPTMNHPAFCIGHLSTYPDRVLQMLDRNDLMDPRDGYEALFKAGVECVEQDGRYPEKSELVEYYLQRHDALLQALPAVPEEMFEQPNPVEGRLREMLPTLGAAVNFVANSHHMSHLGQISAWRRAMGLDSVLRM